MDPASEMAFSALLSYLINLAASFRFEALAEKRRDRLKQALLANASVLSDTLTGRSLREQMKRIGAKVARSKATGQQVKQRQSALDVPAEFDPLVYLFCDDVFQQHLATWLVDV